MSSTRVGILRKVAQLCEKPEELDELRGALRGWRVMGMRITAKTADEIIGTFASCKRSYLLPCESRWLRCRTHREML